MKPPTAEVNLQLNFPQYRHYQAIFDLQGQPYRNRLHFLPWGRGVGKTTYARFIWYMLIAALDGKLRSDALKPVRGVRINCLAPTLVQWKDINWSGIEEELGKGGEWSFLRAKLDRQRGHISFPGGSYIRAFPASEHNSKTARGMRTDVLDADEFDDIESSVYDGVAIPWLSEPWSLGIQLLRGTPTRGHRGLWYRTLESCRLADGLRKGTIDPSVALERAGAKAIIEVLTRLSPDDWPIGLPHDPKEAAVEVLKNYFGWHATYRDAPETVSMLAVAQAKADMPEPVFQREWEANPDAGEGLVYAFDERFHVRQPPERNYFVEFVVGMDHGSTDPGCLLLGGVQGHGEDATLWLLDEWYETDTPNHIWDERASQWRFAKFWPDTSRRDRIQDLRSLGLNVGETDRGPGSILAGIGRVADLLHVRVKEEMGPGFQPVVRRFARLYVSPKCKNTIREFGTYRRKKQPDGSFSELPEDKNNHAMDALRYMALGRFGRPKNHRITTDGR